MVVNSPYSRDNQVDNAIVTISRPMQDFITGGGYIILSDSRGQKPGKAGTRNNFGFNVKYNKNVTSLQGNINTIFQGQDGRIYQVKGNSMTSLGTSPATNLKPFATAVFVGKANIQDITNPAAPIAIDGSGNSSLQVTMTDYGEPGTKDSIAIIVYDKNGNLWFSSKGVAMTKQVLNGGNIQIRSSNSVGATPTLITKTTQTMQLQVAPTEPTVTFDLKAYPNPTTSQFNVQIQSSDATEKVQLRVIDLNGRTVQVLDGLSAGQTIQLGANYRPGMYIIEMIQGRNHKQLKLLKQPD
jgi:hypothetical protein